MVHNRELNIGLPCDNPETWLEVPPAMEFEIVFELLMLGLLLCVTGASLSIQEPREKIRHAYIWKFYQDNYMSRMSS